MCEHQTSKEIGHQQHREVLMVETAKWIFHHHMVTHAILLYNKQCTKLIFVYTVESEMMGLHNEYYTPARLLMITFDNLVVNGNSYPPTCSMSISAHWMSPLMHAEWRGV